MRLPAAEALLAPAAAAAARLLEPARAVSLPAETAAALGTLAATCADARAVVIRPLRWHARKREEIRSFTPRFEEDGYQARPSSLFCLPTLRCMSSPVLLDESALRRSLSLVRSSPSVNCSSMQAGRDYDVDRERSEKRKLKREVAQEKKARACARLAAVFALFQWLSSRAQAAALSPGGSRCPSAQ